MSANSTLYHPETDPYFSSPYIDLEEWRDTPVRHYYVHGGFRHTEENGTEVRFCFYYPEKTQYCGRFFQYLSPAPEDEHESGHLTGEDDKISFCITHGAYYVVSNQGGFQLNDPERLYRSSANAAQFSRQIAVKLYGTDERPYGYVFGGSGGSFKTMGCMEATEGIWNGAVPYVLANPMAVPNVFAPRCRVMRMLGEDGLRKLTDATEPGGSGNILDGFTGEQQEAITEAHRMGFPDRAWFAWKTMGDGALMVLAPYIYRVIPDYFHDFWTRPGFAGSDPNSSEARDRVRVETNVLELFSDKQEKGEFTSVDNSWQNAIMEAKPPRIRIAEHFSEGTRLFHCQLRVLSGEASGAEFVIDTIQNDVVTLQPHSVVDTQQQSLQGLKPGDRVLIDNSDYLAMQTFQRYQIPDESYHVYDQYRNPDGTPKYPQLPLLLSPIIARNGAGTELCGNIHGKMIAVCSLLDESAFPWHGDWYKHAVEKQLAARGEKLSDHFRLYYNDHCLHDDRAGFLDDPQHQVDYLGVLHQALLDIADWCEKGVEPKPSTEYQFQDGQILVPENARERKGLQPVVHAFANGQKAVRVKVGEDVTFTAEAAAPEGTGSITKAAWDFEAENDWSKPEILNPQEDGSVFVRTSHRFQKAGTYFPVIKIQSNREGRIEDIFTQCRNLDRVRVIVEEA